MEEKGNLEFGRKAICRLFVMLAKFDFQYKLKKKESKYGQEEIFYLSNKSLETRAIIITVPIAKPQNLQTFCHCTITQNYGCVGRLCQKKDILI